MRTAVIEWFREKHIYHDQNIIYFSVYVLQIKMNDGKQYGVLEKATKDADGIIIEVKKTASEAAKILNSLRDKISSKVVDEAGNNFKNLQAEHSRYETGWFISFVISIIVLFVSVGVSLFCYPFPEDASVAKIIKYTLEKMVLIFLPSLVTKISLSKYRTERHLNFLYSHRSTVLSQFKEFENSISDSQDKNQFRLEIAKYLFSDPQTGYVKDSLTTDLNFNPIISVMEKFGNSKPS
ncbi:hypothetical protein [Leptospira adleri]|uniref:Uncharacterized protein n=1 Tax=Leptospira adleri TaxID=2023186 RepID=A0A2M9YLW7_9LEPT|nr:hypothetical protein [Leptospira adleri]PJZ52517.1 hypothetical protein CH380_15260 [Leptospira adleri]PJZ63688.1 hypothetical protein CH376_02275 [Leptospira adleri]